MSSLASDKEGRAEQDEANWISTDMQDVFISGKCRTGKVYCRTGCCRNYSRNIGHAVENSQGMLKKMRAVPMLIVHGIYPAPDIHEQIMIHNGYGTLRTSSRTTSTTLSAL